MQLSRKSDYALRALICLAAEWNSGAPDQASLKSVRDLSERNDIPRKYLEAIMRDLKQGNIVESIAGKCGGYRLKKSPADISLGEIIRLFDGSLFTLEITKTPEPPETHSRSGISTLRVQRMLHHIGEELDQLLDGTTLQSILDDKPIHYLITNQDEFAFGDGI